MSYCGDELSFFLPCAVLMLPTLLFQLFPLYKGRHSAPFWSFFFSIVMNIGYGLIFHYFTCQTASNEIFIEIVYGIMGFCVFFTVIPWSGCCCGASFHGNHVVFRQLCWLELNRTDFQNKIANNRAKGPAIMVHAEAYHYETRVEHYTTTDSKGHTQHHTRTRQEKVVTWRGSEELRYSSWQENGNSIRMGDCPIMSCASVPKYKLDSSAKTAVSDLREHMRHRALSHDRYASVWTNFSVPGIHEMVTGITSTKISQRIEVLSSGWGIFLWVLFTIIGYQSAFECAWTYETDRMKLKLIKKVSMHDKYRVRYGNRDDDAAMDTFRYEALPAVGMTQ